MICWIVVIRTLVHLLWLYIIDDEGVIYYIFYAMGPHLLASELMKEKSGETNERKLNTESYLVPRVTNPTRADCLAKPKVVG